MAENDGVMDALMRFFLPNTYNGGTPQEGAPNPMTPPLWRDPNNLDDPLNPRYGSYQEGKQMPEDPSIKGYRRR
jgi:hypothetical protein